MHAFHMVVKQFVLCILKLKVYYFIKRHNAVVPTYIHTYLYLMYYK